MHFSWSWASSGLGDEFGGCRCHVKDQLLYDLYDGFLLVDGSFSVKASCSASFSGVRLGSPLLPQQLSLT